MLNYEALCIQMYVKPFGFLRRASLEQGEDV